MATAAIVKDSKQEHSYKDPREDWVSTADTLPSLGLEVLAIADGELTVAHLSDESELGYHWYSWSAEKCLHSVTHWQFHPALPPEFEIRQREMHAECLTNSALHCLGDAEYELSKAEAIKESTKQPLSEEKHAAVSEKDAFMSERIDLADCLPQPTDLPAFEQSTESSPAPAATGPSKADPPRCVKPQFFKVTERMPSLEFFKHDPVDGSMTSADCLVRTREDHWHIANLCLYPTAKKPFSWVDENTADDVLEVIEWALIDIESGGRPHPDTVEYEPA